MLNYSSIFVASALTLLLANVSVGYPITYSKDGFSVRESVQKRSLPGPVQFARVHKKFRAEVPEAISAVLAASDVIASPGAYDARYLCPVDIGGQILNLDFDTGSADL